jgi:hypothetical protein
MESMIDRVETLIDPDLDSYSDMGEISKPKYAEPQESVAPHGNSGSVAENWGVGEHETAGIGGLKGLKGLIARMRKPAQMKKVQNL